MIYLLIIISIFAVDFTIKHWVESKKSTDFPIAPPIFKHKIILYQNHNPGMIMGFMNKKENIAKLIPFFTTIFLSAYLLLFIIQKGHHFTKLSISLILGGAISNLFDRYHYHYVVDYFSIQWKKLKDIVFNIGDIFIFIGCVCLFLSELLRKH